jgi:hypothetical protein
VLLGGVWASPSDTSIIAGFVPCRANTPYLLQSAGFSFAIIVYMFSSSTI